MCQWHFGMGRCRSLGKDHQTCCFASNALPPPLWFLLFYSAWPSLPSSLDNFPGTGAVLSGCQKETAQKGLGVMSRKEAVHRQHAWSILQPPNLGKPNTLLQTVRKSISLGLQCPFLFPKKIRREPQVWWQALEVSQIGSDRGSSLSMWQQVRSAHGEGSSGSPGRASKGHASRTFHQHSWPTALAVGSTIKCVNSTH